MLEKIWFKLNNTTTGGAILIAFFSVFAKIVGLFRDRILAANFSGDKIDFLDVYYAAFKLPDLVFNTLVLGALASAFIPVFVKYLQKNKEEANQIANSLLNLLLVVISLLTVVFIIFAPWFTHLVVPGFSGEKFALTVSFTRVMFLAILFFTVSNVLSGILNSYKKFLSFSLGPIFYNLGIIFGIVFFTKWLGPIGLAWGVVFGSALHLLVQIPEAVSTGWRYSFSREFKHPAVRRIITLMIPRTFGLAVAQVNQVVTVIIASTLAAGSVAYFNLANNLQSFPISVFGVSIAIACFPVFSQAFAEKNQEKFMISFSVNFRRILYLIVPFSIFLLLLRAQIVRLVLGTGNFTWTDTIQTAQTLGFFSLSLFAQSLIPLLSRSFYAFEDTKTPVLVSIFSVVVNIIGAIILGNYFGIFGVAIAFSIAAILNFIILLTILRFKVGYLDDKKLAYSTLKISFLSLLCGLLGYLVMHIVAPLVNMRTFFGILTQTVSTLFIGGGAYIILSVLFRFEEVEIIGKFLGRYLKVFQKNNISKDNY